MTNAIFMNPHGQGRTWHWNDRMASCGPPRGSVDEWKAARWAIGGFFRTVDGSIGVDCDVRYQPCDAPQPAEVFSGPVALEEEEVMSEIKLGTRVRDRSKGRGEGTVTDVWEHTGHHICRVDWDSKSSTERPSVREFADVEVIE